MISFPQGSPRKPCTDLYLPYVLHAPPIPVLLYLIGRLMFGAVQIMQQLLVMQFPLALCHPVRVRTEYKFHFTATEIKSRTAYSMKWFCCEAVSNTVKKYRWINLRNTAVDFEGEATNCERSGTAGVVEETDAIVGSDCGAGGRVLFLNLPLMGTGTLQIGVTCCELRFFHGRVTLHGRSADCCI